MGKSNYVYSLNVYGMRCGMCETHINNLIRNSFPVKKVKSSRFKKETIIYSDTELNIEEVIDKIASIGYEASLKD